MTLVYSYQENHWKNFCCGTLWSTKALAFWVDIPSIVTLNVAYLRFYNSYTTHANLIRSCVWIARLLQSRVIHYIRWQNGQMFPNKGGGRKLIHEKFTWGQWYAVVIDNNTWHSPVPSRSFVNYNYCTWLSLWIDGLEGLADRIV